jgi:hypothetical protein
MNVPLLYEMTKATMSPIEAKLPFPYYRRNNLTLVIWAFQMLCEHVRIKTDPIWAKSG